MRVAVDYTLTQATWSPDSYLAQKARLARLSTGRARAQLTVRDGQSPATVVAHLRAARSSSSAALIGTDGPSPRTGRRRRLQGARDRRRAHRPPRLSDRARHPDPPPAAPGASSTSRSSHDPGPARHRLPSPTSPWPACVARHPTLTVAAAIAAVTLQRRDHRRGRTAARARDSAAPDAARHTRRGRVDRRAEPAHADRAAAADRRALAHRPPDAPRRRSHRRHARHRQRHDRRPRARALPDRSCPPTCRTCRSRTPRSRSPPAPGSHTASPRTAGAPAPSLSRTALLTLSVTIAAAIVETYAVPHNGLTRVGETSTQPAARHGAVDGGEHSAPVAANSAWLSGPRWRPRRWCSPASERLSKAS